MNSDFQWNTDFSYRYDDSLLTKTDHYISLEFDSKQRVLSSAVLNGGLGEYDYLLNLHVGLNDNSGTEPAETLAAFARGMSWRGQGIGMMTAAAMASLRIHTERVADKYVTGYVTTGLDNLRCVGDRADVQSLQFAINTNSSLVYAPGTINLFIKTNICLSDTALVEAIAMANETKAKVLLEKKLPSPVSGRLATGTGTDSTAIICATGKPLTHYIGKHVIEGQMLARAVEGCLLMSLSAGNLG